MTSLITLIRQHYPTDAEAAARLGISRQAYSQSIKRNRLSERVAMLSAILLCIDVREALFLNLATTDNTPSPVINPAPNPPAELHITTPDNKNYARDDSFKKSAHRADNADLLHKITSPEQEEAIELIRWVYAVARLPADSPRFNWYVSRWCIPDKIARAKENGTFDESTRNCPPIDPAWIRLVPAALKAYQDFVATYPSAAPTKRPSSSKSGKARNIARLAA